VGRIVAGSKIEKPSLARAKAQARSKGEDILRPFHTAPRTNEDLRAVVGGYAFKWLDDRNKAPHGPRFHWNIPRPDREASITRLGRNKILRMCESGLHLVRPAKTTYWQNSCTNLYLAKWWAPFVYDNYGFVKIACRKVQLICHINPIVNSMGFASPADFYNWVIAQIPGVKDGWTLLKGDKASLADQLLFEALGFEGIAFMMTKETFQ